MITAGLLWLALLGQDPAPDPLQIRFLHEGRCDEPCRKERHWKVQAGGGADGADMMQKEADAHRAGAPRPELSERIVFFGGDRNVPWGVVLGAMRLGAQFGIYKMAWEKPGAGKAEMAWKFTLPDPEPESKLLRIADPQIELRWDPERGVIRRISHQKPAPTLDQLMKELWEMAEVFRTKMNRPVFPVMVDAGADVSWKEVQEVMDRVRSEGFDRLEFAPPLRRKAAEKK